jgi:hypothetical protein
MQQNVKYPIVAARGAARRGKVSPTALFALALTPILAVAVVVAVTWKIGPGPVPPPIKLPMASFQLQWSETNFANSSATQSFEGTVEGVLRDRGTTQLFVRVSREKLGWKAIKNEMGWPPKLPSTATGGLAIYAIELTKVGDTTLALPADRILLSAASDDALLRVPLKIDALPIAKDFPEVSLAGWTRDVAASPEGMQSVQPDDVK